MKLLMMVMTMIMMCPMFNILVLNLLFLVILQKPESPPPPPPEEELIEEDIYDEGISFKVSAVCIVNQCFHIDSLVALIPALKILSLLCKVLGT